MTQRLHVEPWAPPYLMRPLRYVDRGRDLVRGHVDCWGFVMLVHREVWGRTLPSLLCYGSAEDPADVAAAIGSEQGAFAVVAERRPGDLVVLRLADARPRHVGVYAGGGHVLHFRRGGAMLAPIDRPPWASRVESVRRAA